jgi:hypothetical protein
MRANLLGNLMDHIHKNHLSKIKKRLLIKRDLIVNKF